MSCEPTHNSITSGNEKSTPSTRGCEGLDWTVCLVVPPPPPIFWLANTYKYHPLHTALASSAWLVSVQGGVGAIVDVSANASINIESGTFSAFLTLDGALNVHEPHAFTAVRGG